jgi:hypothetical protein
MVACNDYRDGAFVGRADAFELIAPDGDHALSFASHDETAAKFACRRAGDPPQLQIRLGGKRRPWFRTLKHVTWAGNWCWNRYWLTDRATARILRMLWASFDCDGGWTHLIDSINGPDSLAEDRPITAALLKAALEEARDV